MSTKVTPLGDNVLIKPFYLNTSLKIFYEILLKDYQNKAIRRQTAELEQYKAIIDEQNLVTEMDLKGKLTFTNAMFVEVSGLGPMDLMDADYKITKHPTVKDEVYTKIWDTITNGESWSGVLKQQSTDESLYYVKYTIVPFFNNDGIIEKFVSTGYIVTDAEEIKEKLMNQLKTTNIRNLQRQNLIKQEAQQKIGENKKLKEALIKTTKERNYYYDQTKDLETVVNYLRDRLDLKATNWNKTTATE